MWVQDLNEFCEMFKGSFPYYLLVFLPILMIISPVSAAHEFPVYRMHQYDLHGIPHGCRSAGVNLEARSVRSWSTSRHCILASMVDLSSQLLTEVKSKAGALVIVLPKDLTKPTAELLELEQDLMREPVPIPVYFAPWTETLQAMVDEVASQPAKVGGTALEAAIAGVSANGFQLVISSSPPAAKDSTVASVQGTLLGRGVPETLPTIAIVAHMDSHGIAPELSFGGDSNASGVSVLLELARIFSTLYSNPRTHARYNFLFLISGAGKLNYLGSKKYLEDQIDSLEGSLLQDAKFVVCLDSLGRGSNLHLHVSKPPKEGSAVGDLLSAAQTVSSNSVKMVHKKINLAEEVLAWEHERYSIRRLPAFTFSSLKNHKDPWRSTIFDRPDTLDLTSLHKNAAIIAESLARVVFNTSETILGGQMDVSKDGLHSWIKLLGGYPRSSALLAADKPTAPIVALKDLLGRHLTDVKVTTLQQDRRDPDLVLFDATASTLHVYSVKPAVFDLLLTVIIAAYLGLVYLVLVKFPDIYLVVSKLVTTAKKHS